MKKKFSMKAFLVLTTVAAAMALTSMPASAATGPAPGTGLIGACNMVGDAPLSAMFSAMTLISDTPGFANMFHATDVSGGGSCGF